MENAENRALPLLDLSDREASDVRHWKAKNEYFYEEINSFHRFLISPGQRVAEVGAGTGDLLASLEASYACALDMNPRMLAAVNETYPQIQTEKVMCEEVDKLQKLSDMNFDYVIANGTLCFTPDVQQAIRGLAALGTPRTRFVVSVYNAFWEPILALGSKLGLRSKTPMHNWLSDTDLENLFFLEDLEVVSRHHRVLMPKYVPLLSWLANRILVNLPVFRSMALMRYFVLRKRTAGKETLSSTIVIPARNEAGNIENAVKRLPAFGTRQEIIFVEGNSTDHTWNEIERVRLKYADKNIVTLKQPGKGKGDAVRHGFVHASGDLLFILDADLTVPPEDLPKFYQAVAENRGEFINGTRLVYPMEKQAMRFLNLLGNKFFAWVFSWLLGQRFRDTLCGTKVLRKSDYEKIAANRNYFGDFDPFGDFDLLFGAAKQNLKIVEIPIRYKERVYGETNISRFRHGWLLLKMCVYAAKKIKFR
jgi:hypothetical protein